MVSPEKTKHPEPANDGDESPWDSSEADDSTNKPAPSSFKPGLKTASSPAGVRTCVRETRALAAVFVYQEALGRLLQPETSSFDLPLTRLIELSFT